ncbi:MAG TPA: carboxypeptidase regulatory-like domain-containing protein [Acidimicrobiales bacterium]|nr:carboxypeptidase regulatory-like domain-containing protein [Acidimicrobiales bacterium]
MRPRRAARPALLAAAFGLAGAACGNQLGSTQVPATVTGLVTAGPTCPVVRPGLDCADRPLGGAEVDAVGKDGVHRVNTDATGHYRFELLTGQWTLRAVGGIGGRGGREVSVFLQPGQQTHIDLQVDTGLR